MIKDSATDLCTREEGGALYCDLLHVEIKWQTYNTEHPERKSESYLGKQKWQFLAFGRSI